MGIWENFADRSFAKDEAGRLVFLPSGPRRTAYLVDAADAQKIRPLVKIYGLAAALINMTGSTAALAFTAWLASDEHPASLAHKLEFGAVICAISASLLFYGPALLLWKVYRGSLDEISLSLTSVDPSSVHLMRLASRSNRAVVMAVVMGLLLLVLGIVLAVSYRH